MAEIKVNSLIKLQTLCLLDKGPKHGYEIMKSLRELMDQSISASHVYPFLKGLEKKSYVLCRKIGGRDKKRYHLTPEGTEFVRSTFSRLVPMANYIAKISETTCPHCNGVLQQGSHKKKTELYL